jgi:hypothetical protein
MNGDGISDNVLCTLTKEIDRNSARSGGRLNFAKVRYQIAITLVRGSPGCANHT